MVVALVSDWFTSRSIPSSKREVTRICKSFLYSVFGSTFVELILDRIDFVEIDLVRIDFEVK